MRIIQNQYSLRTRRLTARVFELLKATSNLFCGPPSSGYGEDIGGKEKIAADKTTATPHVYSMTIRVDSQT